MEKKPFVTKEQLEEIAKTYPTPFYLYDEKGIRENALKLKEAFSWNKGFREYFAVKATPNPFILKILQELGCGTDCSSKTELLMSDACGFSGHDIMFSSNDTPPEEFKLAYDLGAIINLDDFTHIECLEKTIGTIPETICCRFNPGGDFVLENEIMDTPQEAKYGMTREQLIEAFKYMKQKGVKHFGIHAFLASNTVANEYYPALARILFKLAVEVQKETGVHITDAADLISVLRDFAGIRQRYERLHGALDQVQQTGYGIVMPSTEELTLEEPEIVRQGGRYGVRLRASAPSIHLLSASIRAEVNPIVGSEKQSEELVHYLLSEFRDAPEKIWETNIFGKSLSELVREELSHKLSRMPDDARSKIRETLEKIINENAGGLICIIL